LREQSLRLKPQGIANAMSGRAKAAKLSHAGQRRTGRSEQLAVAEKLRRFLSYLPFWWIFWFVNNAVYTRLSELDQFFLQSNPMGVFCPFEYARFTHVQLFSTSLVFGLEPIFCLWMPIDRHQI